MCFSNYKNLKIVAYRVYKANFGKKKGALRTSRPLTSPDHAAPCQLQARCGVKQWKLLSRAIKHTTHEQKPCLSLLVGKPKKITEQASGSGPLVLNEAPCWLLLTALPGHQSLPDIAALLTSESSTAAGSRLG